MNVVLTKSVDEPVVRESVELLQRYRRILDHDLTHVRTREDRDAVEGEINRVAAAIDQLSR